MSDKPERPAGQPQQTELTAKLLWDVSEGLRRLNEETLPPIVLRLDDYAEAVQGSLESAINSRDATIALRDISEQVADSLKRIDNQQAEILERLESLERKL